MKSLQLLSIIVFLLFSTLHLTAAVNFTCNATKTATCQGLIGYVPSNATTLDQIQTLFQVPSLLSLLGANNLPLSTPSSHPHPAASTVLIPFPCTCSDGIGRSDHTPFYTVKSTDTGLDAIARTTFDQFVTYQEIAAANGLKNPNVITVGEKLWIPLPCSCDPVKEVVVVHLGHVVAAGSTVQGIADEFGTTAEVVIGLNGISNPKLLQTGQVLDVPLKACNSSISDTSLDHNLLLPATSSALTADDCIQCSCSSSTYQLTCQSTQGISKVKCPVSKCGSQFIGYSTTNGCNVTECSYTGYTNSTGLKITASITTRSLCNNGSSPAPGGGNSQPSGNSAGSRLRLQGYRSELLLLLALFWFGFLGWN